MTLSWRDQTPGFVANPSPRPTHTHNVVVPVETPPEISRQQRDRKTTEQKRFRSTWIERPRRWSEWSQTIGTIGTESTRSFFCIRFSQFRFSCENKTPAATVTRAARAKHCTTKDYLPACIFTLCVAKSNNKIRMLSLSSWRSKGKQDAKSERFLNICEGESFVLLDICSTLICRWTWHISSRIVTRKWKRNVLT